MLSKFLVSVPFILAMIVSGCENSNNPLSPTKINSESSSQAVVNNEESAVSAESGNMKLGLTASDSGQTCGNPSDWLPDDLALQNCLDRGGFISLDNGDPG